MIETGNRIDQLFADRQQKRFIPFLTVGDPSLEVSMQILHAVVEAGSELVELGVPYSDPLADGSTIQRASQRALQAGVTIADVLSFVRQARQEGISIPLVLFSYYNPVLQYGLDRFFADLAASGADGIVIPDLPMEESGPARKEADAHGVHVISLVAPTSAERIARIAQQASGFLYCVSSLGVTGVRDQLPAGLEIFMNEVRRQTTLPLAVGFGISTPEQVSQAATCADGVVVGSAIVQQVEHHLEMLADAKTRGAAVARIKMFVQRLAGALK